MQNVCGITQYKQIRIWSTTKWTQLLKIKKKSRVHHWSIIFWYNYGAKRRRERKQLLPTEVWTDKALMVEEVCRHTSCHWWIWYDDWQNRHMDNENWHLLPSGTIREKKPLRNSKNNSGKWWSQRKIAWYLRLLVWPIIHAFITRY